MANCLVTGGAGFIGSHVADTLLTRGHDVVVLDDLSGGIEANVPEDAGFVHGSVCDDRLVRGLFGDGVFEDGRCDYVFHLAAYAAEGLSHFIRRFNYETNVGGSVNLINAAVRHGVKRFVFTSSMAVYGSQVPPFTEAMTPAPEDPYGIAKYAVELDLKAAHDLWGMDYTIFRPHNVYGPRQNIRDRYRNVVGIFMRQALAGEPLTVFGDGEQVRAFSYINDVAPFIADCVAYPETANETFNIGGDMPTTVNSLASYICETMGAAGIEHLPPRHEVREAHCDHGKLRAMGWHPRVALFDGLSVMAEWVKAQPPGEPTPLPTTVEVERGLPAIWRVGVNV